MAGDGQEREYQFDCVDLDAVDRWIRSQPEHARLTFRAEPQKTQLDIYLDTTDWAINRAGFTLRVRRKADGSEATLKSMGKQGIGPLSRREINEPLDGADGLVTAAGAVSGRVKLMTGGRPVEALFEVETDRRVFRVERQGVSLAEISLDDTRVLVDNERRRTFKRVEVEETARGGLDEVQAFIEAMTAACHLAPASVSKFASGLAAADLHPEQAFELGHEELSPDATSGEYAYALLRGYFKDFLEHEPGTRLGEDPEELHDMRVATRKLRAAMSTFEAALPLRFQALRDELKWVGGCLGEVRDLDVQIEWLEEEREQSGWEEATAIGPLIAERLERRNEERTRLLEALDGERYRRMVRDITTALREGDDGKGDAAMPIREYGARLLKKRYRQFEREADAISADSPAELYHATRIRAKRLRYTADALSDVYGRRATELIVELKAVQDLLGEHQDCAVAIDWLRATALSGRSWPALTLLRTGEMIEQRRHRMVELRAAWPDAYEAIEKRWPPLRRATRKAAKSAEDEVTVDADAGASGRPPVQRPLSIFRRFFSRGE